MEQQGTSTPAAASAADPSPSQGVQHAPSPDAARRIGQGVEANIPGGGDAWQEIAVPTSPSARPEGIVSDPDRRPAD
jgi:hypothetical protein